MHAPLKFTMLYSYVAICMHGCPTLEIHYRLDLAYSYLCKNLDLHVLVVIASYMHKYQWLYVT